MDQLRTVLSHLQAPHRLDTPQIRALLAHHRRLPPSLSPTAVGHAAAQLLTDKIVALDPGPEAPAPGRLPYEVLETCFLRGRKNFQAAAELSLSERQVTRERERALRLLAAELGAPPAAALAPQSIPSIEGHIRRGGLLRHLTETVATKRLVGVTGESGSGKTALVAALAHALGPETVWWHRIRPGISDSLEALLLELGQALAREAYADLRDYLAGALPGVDSGVATRLALEGVAGRRRLVVLDDFGSTSDPKTIEPFLEEVVERLPRVCVVTVGGALCGAVVVDVPPLSGAETAELFRERTVSPAVFGELRELSHGNARMLAAVAAWWSGEQRAVHALERHVEGREALTNLADLIGFSQRGAA